MALVNVMAEGFVGAPARLVYDLIRDIREHHPRFLPANFSDLEIEQGGVGAVTIFTFTGTFVGSTRRFRMRVDEPEPGRVITESDTMSSMVTTWTLTPEGDSTRVQIETRWNGTEGMAGFMERTVLPMLMRRVYNDELRRLDRYAREQASQQTLAGSRR
jgi:hypothetical protein